MNYWTALTKEDERTSTDLGEPVVSNRLLKSCFKIICNVVYLEPYMSPVCPVMLVGRKS